MSPHTCSGTAAWGTWLSPQLAVVAVSSGWGVWHHLAWQVTVWAQASSCPAGASLYPRPVPTGRMPSGQLRERGDRKELLSFIVPSSAGSDNSFLPHVSSLAMGPMGQGCSHRAAAQCSEGMTVWDWNWGGSDPWAMLAAEGLWGHGWELFCGEPAQFSPLLRQLQSGSNALCPPDARDAVCLLSCLQLVPVIPGWAEGMVKSCPPLLQLSLCNPLLIPTHQLISWLIPQAINTALPQRAPRPCGHPTGQ